MTDVNYKIGADATAVVQEIGKVRKSLTGLGKMRWSELAMGVQAVMANLALLKNAAVGAFNAVIKPAAEVEQYMVRFETVLGSARKASQHMAKLREYAAQTPFEMSDIADASGVLLGFGTEAEKSNQVLRQLGDIAAVSGANLKDLAMIYGKVAAVGLETESVNQLAERQVNVRALLAERDGISIAEVQKRISSKQYGIADLDYVLGITTGAGGMHAGGAAKQAQTINGIMSTFRDNLNEIAVTIGEQFAPALRQMFDKLGTMLPQLQDTAQKLAKPVGQILNTLVDTLPLVCKWIEFMIGRIEIAAEIFSRMTALGQTVSKDIRNLLGIEEQTPKRKQKAAVAPPPTGSAADAQARAAEKEQIAAGERAAKLEQLLEKQLESATATAETEIFGKLSAAQQAKQLQDSLRTLGFTGRIRNSAQVAQFLHSIQKSAAAAGNEDLFNYAGTLSSRYDTLQQTSATAAEARHQAHTALARAHIVEGGNAMQLQRFDATQSAWAMAQQYMAAGMGQSEATRLAATQAARSMQPLDTPNPALVTQSKVAVGGGGVSLRIGDAQLDIARRHLNVGEEIKRITQDLYAMLARSAGSNSIPVTL